jgi:hypothetical protein
MYGKPGHAAAAPSNLRQMRGAEGAGGAGTQSWPVPQAVDGSVEVVGHARAASEKGAGSVGAPPRGAQPPPCGSALATVKLEPHGGITQAALTSG